MHSRPPLLPMLVLASCSLAADDASDASPRELGRVTWQRTLEPALAESGTTGRPVLLLFQEIPGCQGCVDFGRNPLSHPLLVEVMETEFVPVAIHNNRPGYDEEVRKHFDEPAWNFPVMRFLGADGEDLLPRRDRIFQTAAVADRLVQALEAAGRPVPDYLRLAAVESSIGDAARATFTMHCFWVGEGVLGGLPGVIDTRAAWVGDHEAVEVRFDPALLEYDDLLATARRTRCADLVLAHDETQLAAARKAVGDDARPIETPARDAAASDQTHALRGSSLAYLPLTPMQATKVNADLHADRDPGRWLSPRQTALHEMIVVALRDRGDLLVGPERPDEIAALLQYELELRRRLAPEQQTLE